MRKTIQNIVAKALKDSFGLEKEILVDIPKDAAADYSVNTALQCAKELGKSPKEIAETLVKTIVETQSAAADASLPENPFEKIEIAGPGFINFTLSKSALTAILDEKNWGQGDDLDGKRIMVEFACPNTHKAFHIGHLRNICLGESILRLQESQGAKTFRANYQGDIGPHVAKCLWALKNSELRTQITEIAKRTPQEKAEFLGKVYAMGSKAYEADEQVKKEILAINKALYTEPDAELLKLYQQSRNWSLEYFEFIYQRLGTKPFDHYFFESETWKPGKEIVEKNIGTIFQKSEGAVVFPGENFGLHTRVFISSEGNPTYEAKEVGLAPMQYQAFPFDSCIHVVANEQAEYFRVVIEVINQLYPQIQGKEKHLSYGMVKLTSGKMSSRTGDVITAEWLIEEAKSAIREKLNDKELSAEEKENIAEMVAIGAIKFTMLHTQAKNDIAFDLEKAVRLDGDSGPYIQYAHARICSILKKNSVPLSEIRTQNSDFSQFNADDWSLLKKIQYFPYHVSRSASELTAHHISHYLLQLTSEFSAWYAKNSVQNAETEGLKQARIELLQILKTTIKNGLYLMGIEAPEKM